MISATVSFPWSECLYSLLGRGLAKALNVTCTFFTRKRKEVRKDLVTLCQSAVNLSAEPPFSTYGTADLGLLVLLTEVPMG